MRAGLPATMAYGGTDSTTTAPAPTIAPRPIVMPGQDRRVGADRRALLHDASCRKLPAALLAAREAVVRERRVRADEDVVLDAHAVPELDAALDRHAVADDDVVLDEDVVADVAVGADARAGQHVRERPDARAARRPRAISQSACGCTKTVSFTAAQCRPPNVKRRCTMASGRALVFSNARHAYAPTTEGRAR